jgi:membrane protein YdbS with pleckstrin-like domain
VIQTDVPPDLATPAPAEAAPIADGVDRPLDPRFIPLQQAIGWIVTGVLGGGSLVALLVTWLVGRPSWPVWLVLVTAWLFVTGGLAWLAHYWPAIEYRHTSYRVDGQGLEIRRGVHWRTVTDVPRSRVQHTDVSQGPLERGHGLGTLVVYTAGTDHAKVELGGLDHAIAMRIREHLLPREPSDGV